MSTATGHAAKGSTVPAAGATHLYEVIWDLVVHKQPLGPCAEQVIELLQRLRIPKPTFHISDVDVERLAHAGDHPSVPCVERHGGGASVLCATSPPQRVPSPSRPLP